MSREDYHVAVAAMNGRPQRLVTLDRKDGTAFRDHINPDSARSRKNFIRAAASKFGVDVEALDFLDDDIVSATDEADARAEAEAETGGNREERKSQATRLVELAGNIELFHDPEGNGFARFPVDEHFEVAGVRNKRFRTWLSRLHYLTEGKAPSSQALQDAIGVLEGKAMFEGQKRSVYVRVAGDANKIYIDLCNDDWQVVEVSATGWRVLADSPVMFRRPKAMLPLPVPVAGRLRWGTLPVRPHGGCGLGAVFGVAGGRFPPGWPVSIARLAGRTRFGQKHGLSDGQGAGGPEHGLLTQ